MKFQITNKKQCIFDPGSQMALIKNNTSLIDFLKPSISIKDWNDRRNKIKAAFRALTQPDKDMLELMFLGYADTVVFKQVKTQFV